MKPEICSGRLNLVVCVIAYRDTPNGYRKFLMTQREDGKFALIGGMGACCLSETMFEFAKREFEFDTGVDAPIDKFRYVESLLDSNGTTLTLLFSYHYERDDWKDATGEWLSAAMIGELAEDGKIAFNGDRHIANFIIK